MKFKLDENLPESLIALLSNAGFDASSATSQGLGGQTDARVAQVCREEKRVLVTLDVGFADIRAYPPHLTVPSSQARIFRFDETCLASFS